MNLAIIPARGGSKRIPRKNIRLFCGKPIISWSIKAAIESHLFGRIIVSTDDMEIADIAKEAGAEIPFMRPRELAGDNVATLDVIRHAIKWTEANNSLPSFVCCLYATAPMVTSKDLVNSFHQIEEDSGMEFLFSATRFNYPIFRALKKEKDNRYRMFWPEHEYTRSQDLEEAYHDAGQFYWGRTGSFLKNQGIFSSPGGMYLIPGYKVQDIDTMEDWERAEVAFKILNPHLDNERGSKNPGTDKG